MFVRFALLAALAAALAGCGPDYSPNTYASNAVQQANAVVQGVVVGVRQVDVSAAAGVGTVTGAAAGGIAGSQVGVGPARAFSALGGSLVGGIAGAAAEHATSDTTAFEYIVRKTNGDLLSVTQKDEVPLTIGQKVLVIAGNQARVVADYTVPVRTEAAEPKPAPKDATAPQHDAVAATPLAPAPLATEPVPGTDQGPPTAASPTAVPSP